MNKDEIEKRIKEIDEAMYRPDFWSDTSAARAMIKEQQDLKDELEGGSKYDRGGAILNIYSGAGGDDADDFARILFDMYRKYIEGRGWALTLLSESKSDFGGIKSLSATVEGKNVFGALQGESGVHRLVRLSPFNANNKRQTSFVMVEFVPKIEDDTAIEIKPEDIDMQFSRSGGPGGQNVNKVETAVRIVHKETGVSVYVTSERSQGANRDKAMEALRGKLYLIENKRKEKEARGLSSASDTAIEWGSQIRSYVFHPYQMIKDHRTGVEVRNIDKVLAGDLSDFIV